MGKSLQKTWWTRVSVLVVTLAIAITGGLALFSPGNTSADNPVTDGQVNGTITYTASDGSNQLFGPTTLHLTMNGVDVPTSVSSLGKYNALGMQPGTYTATATYTLTTAVGGDKAGSVVTLSGQNVTVKYGQISTADLSAGKPAPPGTGTGTTPPGTGTPPVNGKCPTNQSIDATSGNCVDTSNTGDDTVSDCGFGGWNWAVCGGMGILTSISDKLDSMIMQQLNIDTNGIFAGTNKDAYYSAWNSFRIIATAIIVIAGLVMVASQAFGFEFLDAYTIRKTLPRLLVAIIGISLSWELLQVVIQLFNVIGFDIRNLMYAPFSAISAGAGHPGTIATLGNPLTLIVAGGALFLIYGPATLTFLVTAFLAILVAFFVLVVRQIAIVVLVIMAPVAIACYILPNTQKIWKFWKDNFLGLMVMFPIISALIAAGHIMSAVGRFGGPFEQFVSIVAYFAPYFLLPLAFRLATGVIGNLAGIANDRSRGAFDRLKKGRENSRLRRREEFRTGDLGNNVTNRAYNRMGINSLGRRMDVGMAGHYGIGQRGQSALATKAAVQQGAAMKAHPELAAFAQGDDNGNAVLGLSGGTLEGGRAAAAQLFEGDLATQERAVQAAAAIGFNRTNASASLVGLAQNKSRAVGAGRTDLIRDGIDRLAGENDQMAEELVGTFAFVSRQAGRVDLGGMNWGHRGAAGADFTDTVEQYATNLAGGTPVTAQHRQQAFSDLSVADGLNRTKVQDTIVGHTAGMQAAVDNALRLIEHGPNQAARETGATLMLEFQQNLNSASMDNQRIINAGVSRAGVSYDSGNGSVAQQLAVRIGGDATNISRGARTYSEDMPMAARGATPPTPPPTDEE